MNLKPLPLLVSGLLAIGASNANADDSESTLIISDHVESYSVNQSIKVIGTLNAKESVVLSPETNGKVSNITVVSNQKVNEGQRLVTLDDSHAKASVSEAETYLQNEIRKLKELEVLLAKEAISLTEVEAARANVNMAKARLDASQANLDDMYVTAPFTGTVGFIDFSKGEMVDTNSELFTLDNLSKMHLDLQVPEKHLPRIQIGADVTATTNAWGDKEFFGSIVGIDSRVNNDTLNLRVRLSFNNDELKLKPGMLMSAELEFPSIDAPIVPVQALQYSGTKRFVYVVDDSNMAHKREVFLGARVDNEVVIEKGIDVGDRIVIEGLVNMRNDQQLVREAEVTHANSKTISGNGDS